MGFKSSINVFYAVLHFSSLSSGRCGTMLSGGNSIKINWRGKRDRVLIVSKTSPPGLKGTAFISYSSSIIFSTAKNRNALISGMEEK